MTRPQTSWTARIAAVAVMLGLAVACSIDVDVANKACPCGEGYVCDDQNSVCVLPQDLKAQQIPVPACDPCTCASDTDCKDPTRSRCSPSKVCVECGQTPDTCSVGYCNDLFQCTAGCKAESDCQTISPGTHCQLQRHQCVECVAPAFPCKTAGTACSPSGACVESCSVTKPCTGAKLCCNGLCLDTTSDVLNCGKCDFPCSTTNGSPACPAGTCAWSCASGFLHCGGGANSGCETNIRTDLANCGKCGTACGANMNANGLACSAGACAYSTCKDLFADLDSNRTNGCESTCGAKGQDCCPTGRRCANGGCNGGGKCPQ